LSKLNTGVPVIMHLGWRVGYHLFK